MNSTPHHLRREFNNFLERSTLYEDLSLTMQVLKPTNLLLKKDQRFEWTTDSQEDFNNIKKEITTTPVLINPDFQRDFIIYSFSTEMVVASILT